MIYTHVPSNSLPILAAVMPTAPTAIFRLLLKMCLSQMDVPARQSYVMAVVPPEERAAAASVTEVPRSMVSASLRRWAAHCWRFRPLGWSLVIGGLAKAIYDLLISHLG
jgi:hypothetical protein